MKFTLVTTATEFFSCPCSSYIYLTYRLRTESELVTHNHYTLANGSESTCHIEVVVETTSGSRPLRILRNREYLRVTE